MRINYLDGHRGLAILLVILFHAYSRRPEVMPYGASFSEFPVFQYGHLGVQLFFLISGFVILMTLEKCDNILSFIYRRWLRLFPAMMICSLIIYFTAELFTERPSGQPLLQDIIPGLSFVEPYIWEKVTGLQLNDLEGAFWSLYVEFKFYVIAAVLYFAIGSRKLVYALFLCALIWLFMEYLVGVNSTKVVSVLHTIVSLLSFKYFGWFAAGAAYYLYVKTKELNWFYCGVVFSLASSLIESDFILREFIPATVISLFFAASIISTALQSVMSSKFFLYFGFVSYPLYLLHESIMVSSTITLAKHVGSVPAYLLPIAVVLCISVLCYFISKYAEPAVKNSISSGFSRIGCFNVKQKETCVSALLNCSGV